MLAPIPEEGDSMDTTMPEIADSGPEIRPRQPESEPGSEPADRNVRPRLAPDQEVIQLDEVENSQSTTQARRDVGHTPDEVHVDNPSDAASSILSPYPLVSASNFLMTVLPVETEFDSKAQAVVHGSVDAVTGKDSTIFEAIEGMAVFDSETQSFGKHPDRKTRVVWSMMSCRKRTTRRSTQSRFKEIDNLLKLTALSVMVYPRKVTTSPRQHLRIFIPTNMLDKWKLQDDGSVAAKSRSVLVFWKDPMIYQLERAAPTPTQEGIKVTL